MRGRTAAVRRTADGVEGSVNVLSLLHSAYGAQRYKLDEQITGMPEWTNSTRYELHAKMSEADAAEFQKLSADEQENWIESMLQTLLAERFHLNGHTTTKQLPMYDLVVAKGGFKPKPLDENVLAAARVKGGFNISPNGKLTLIASSMDSFVLFLSTTAKELGRPVVNKTNLPGHYDLTLGWSPFRPAAPLGDAGSTHDTSSSIYTALQDDLGLKLQPATGTAEVLVIDHIEKPTAN